MLQILRSAFIMACAAAAVVAGNQHESTDQLIFGKDGDSVEIKTFDKPALSDLLTIDPSISVFYDYVRQSETLVSQILPLAMLLCPAAPEADWCTSS